MDGWMIFSISADVFCILLCGLAMLVVLLRPETLKQNNRHLFAIFSCHGLCVLCNLLGLVFKGRPGGLVHGVLLCSNFGEFGFQYITGFFLAMYFIQRLVPEDGQKNWKRTAAALCAAELLVLAVSQPTGFYYVIDAENFYRRAAGFPVSLLFGMLTPALDLILVLRYRKTIHGAEKFAMWTYLVLPAGAMVVQIFIYGIYVLLLADTVAITIMILILLSLQSQEYYQNQQMLFEMREKLMLSQIQPHFLYNALNSIYHLCSVDPQKAQTAIANFSDYLRGNLDSLNRKAVVPFETELEQVRHYLALETMRYEDLLHVDDSGIEATGFLLPFVSVQPLVENAVKHGLADKPEGGTIWLSSRETPAGYEVVIRDDGVGFDPAAPDPEDGRSHIGIDSVRSRLRIQSGGTLTLHSAPGAGTTAAIFIPKE